MKTWLIYRAWIAGAIIFFVGQAAYGQDGGVSERCQIQILNRLLHISGLKMRSDNDRVKKLIGGPEMKMRSGGEGKVSIRLFVFGSWGDDVYLIDEESLGCVVRKASSQDGYKSKQGLIDAVQWERLKSLLGNLCGDPLPLSVDDVNQGHGDTSVVLVEVYRERKVEWAIRDIRVVGEKPYQQALNIVNQLESQLKTATSEGGK